MTTLWLLSSLYTNKMKARGDSMLHTDNSLEEQKSSIGDERKQVTDDAKNQNNAIYQRIVKLRPKLTRHAIQQALSYQGVIAIHCDDLKNFSECLTTMKGIEEAEIKPILNKVKVKPGRCA